jgi:hypothetical protein
MAEARQRPDPSLTIRPTAPSAQSANLARIDQSSAIAGQLNIMLLSGPERMSQNLAALADVLGTALRIERQSDESLNDYMGRLIEGIASLPAGERVKLQKLLSQAFAGLQLRTLLAAMASPSGPERATLALYLELYRQSDRDGATRSVISSYRELGTEGRGTGPMQGRPPAANDGLGATKQVARGTVGSASSSLAASSAPTSVAQPAGEARTSSAAATSASGGGAPLGPSGGPAVSGANPETRADPLARYVAPIREAVPAASAPAAGREVQGQPAPSPEPPKQNGEAAVARQETAETRAAGEGNARPGVDRRAVASALAQAQAMVPVAKPIVPQVAAPGWLGELLQTDFVRALLQLKTIPADLIKTPAKAGEPDDQAASDTPMGTPPMAAGDTEEDGVRALRTLDVRNDAGPSDADPQPAALPVVEQPAVRLAVGRDGIPLPFVTYMIADDGPGEEVEEPEDRERDDDEASHEGDSSGDDEVADERPDESIENPVEASRAEKAPEQGRYHAVPVTEVDSQDSLRRALPAPSDTALPLPPEPAHELYLRMAGLN